MEIFIIHFKHIYRTLSDIEPLLRLMVNIHLTNTIKTDSLWITLSQEYFGDPDEDYYTFFRKNAEIIWSHRNNVIRWIYFALKHGWRQEKLRELKVWGVYSEGYYPECWDCVKFKAEVVREGPQRRIESIPGGSGYRLFDDGEFPLLKAAFSGQRENVLMFLRSGHDVNMSTLETKLTAIMPTVYRRHLLILCDLFAWGADLYATDRDGYTVFHYSVKRDYFEALGICLELCGHHLNPRLLHQLVLYACARGSHNCLALLIPMVENDFLDIVRCDIEILPRTEKNTIIRELLGLSPKKRSSIRSTYLIDCSLRYDDSISIQLRNARFQKDLCSRYISANRIHCYGAQEQGQAEFLTQWFYENKIKQFLWIDCYRIASEGTIENWIESLRTILNDLDRDIWTYFSGYEAFFLGFTEPEIDSIPLEILINNYRNIAFGVLDEKFLRRRTNTIGITAHFSVGDNANLFLSLCRAGNVVFEEKTTSIFDFENDEESIYD